MGVYLQNTSAIYFCLHSGNSYVARIIKRTLCTEYNHSLSIYWSKDLNNWVITEADMPGVLVRKLDLRTFEELVHVYEFIPSIEALQKYFDCIYRYNGKDYSETQLLLQLAALITRNFRAKINNDDSFICSEYVDTLIKACGLTCAAKQFDISPDFVNPKHNKENWDTLTKDGFLNKVK